MKALTATLVTAALCPLASAQFTPFCNGVVNSTGNVAAISATGDTDPAANNLSLQCANLPNDSFGVFVVDDQAAAVATTPGGSVGNLCLPVGFDVFRSAVQSTGAGSQVSLALDLTAVPTGGAPAAVLPGDSLFFQYWYRDLGAGGATTNLSDGVAVQFDPPVASFTFDASTNGLRYDSFQDTSPMTPSAIAWDFDFQGNPMDPAQTFVAQVTGTPGGSTTHIFPSTGQRMVAMRATFSNGVDAYDVQTVNVDAVVLADVVGILQASCATCHTTGSSGGINFLISLADLHDDLVGVASTASCNPGLGSLIVDPFDSANSYLFGIAGASPSSLCGMSRVTSSTDVALLAAWIDEGAAEN